MMIRLIYIIIALLIWSDSVHAQLVGGPYVIQTLDINGGGTTSTGGPYSISASTGQAGGVGTIIAEPVPAPPLYQFDDGFWSTITADCNGNGIPDECDPDCDQDGVPDECDGDFPCETDSDGDGVPDVNDNCVNVPNPDQTNSDADTLGDACDNCTTVPNPDQADCSMNGVGNACDSDCNANGIADDCEGEIIICSANPPLDNPYVAGQQPFRDPLQDRPCQANVHQGIGSCLTPNEGFVSYCTITIQLSGAPVAPLTADEVDVQCSSTGIPAGSWPCPTVAGPGGVSNLGNNQYQLRLTDPIPAGGCVSIGFGLPVPGQFLKYESLPGDVSMDGSVNTQDLLALIQCLNGLLGPATLPRCDINRDGSLNTQDLLRLIQLLNGTCSTRVWNGAALVGCP